MIDQLEEFREWIEPIITTIFIIGASISGLIVAIKFINSRDKKEAVNYAIWWVVGIFFFFVCRSIISELMDSFGD